MADQKFASIDDYIGSFPAEVRTVLEKVRQTVRTAVPDADETDQLRHPDRHARRSQAAALRWLETARQRLSGADRR